MRRLGIAFILAAALAGVPQQASAGNGVAVGFLGGLAAGAVIGSVAAQPRYYYAPYPVVVAAPPAPVGCYWTRGEPEWDASRGVWMRPRVQVCN
jgi:hypothetical protein